MSKMSDATIYTHGDWMWAMDTGEELPRVTCGHSFRAGDPVYVTAAQHEHSEYVGDVVDTIGDSVKVELLGVGLVWMHYSTLAYDNRPV